MLPTTPENVFTMTRRQILAFFSCCAAGALVPESLAALAADASETPTAEKAFTSYNNFYEFGFSKKEPAAKAKGFPTAGWTLEVNGLVAEPLRLDIPELISRCGEEERVYRLRCVEGWSMVVPWTGCTLQNVLALAGPLPEARYVSFESAADPLRMPQVAAGRFPFPYREGLRLDEAMHPLTLLATGAYGKPLAPQNGAPLRLVVPWKYGFKSLKSMVTMTLTAERPATTWDAYNPKEYGFYATVNPDVPHPRWSQKTERLFGPGGLSDVTRQPTRLFNGYDEVASLYAGMDLAKEY